MTHRFDTMQEIVQLVADASRTPLFAGSLGRHRVYLRDFVVCRQNVLAICNSGVVHCPEVTNFASPSWTILTDEFTPLGLYKLLQIRATYPLKTLSHAFLHGYLASTSHPNRIYNRQGEEMYFCNDCHVLHPEQYEVQSSVWSSAVRVALPCKLCLKCLSFRIERQFVPDDFTSSAKNNLLRLGYAMATR